MEANEAEEILEALSKKKGKTVNSLAQVEYLGKENSQIMFRVRDAGMNEVAACFPFVTGDVSIEDVQTTIQQMVYNH